MADGRAADGERARDDEIGAEDGGHHRVAEKMGGPIVGWPNAAAQGEARLAPTPSLHGLNSQSA